MMPLRVGQVTLTMGQGGIENLIASLARAVNRETIQFSLYCLDGGGELLTTVNQLGIPTKIFKRRPGLDWRLIVTLAKAFRDDGIHVVHTHNQAAHFYGCLAARLARIPVVINTEHSRHYIQGYMRRRLEKRILSILADKIVTVSEELRQKSIELDRIDGQKCCVVQNGVDLDKFSFANPGNIRASLSISEGSRVIAIVARLHPVKNHRLLFDAVRLFMSSINDIYLLVIGDGELRDELETEASLLGIRERTFFLGSRRDIPALMAAADVLVLCSKSEGLPLVLLEGMASGTPVIVTEEANRAGLIQHKRNGFVCGSTPSELAVALHEVISREDEIVHVTESARRVVAARYSIRSTVQQYEEIYFSILSRKAPAIARQIMSK